MLPEARRRSIIGSIDDCALVSDSVGFEHDELRIELFARNLTGEDSWLRRAQDRFRTSRRLGMEGIRASASLRTLGAASAYASAIHSEVRIRGDSNDY